ncbi:MAG: ABC transporter ATP-binding protein [Polyangiaceae bacterium UTPRO1]|nr:ABC transporter ATP-binding protein [Myxococcales bacterium]OQY68838.1 MAG: ABC transporter ATP-binding protein [Polyangiaceae bacterium UTPRO1]
MIALRNLSKEYVDGPRVVRVLSGLDLEIERGERVAIVGESGVGKSTLLHILGTLDRPTGGEVWFDGENLTSKSDRELALFRNREVGFIFQFHHLLPDFTAVENVMMPALIAGTATAVARARATALLTRVGLEERLEHRPGELSGGEQQRVAVARALVQEPRALLADEPTGNLDPVTGEGVQNLLLELNREHGSTLVVVTHSASLAGAMDRTLRLHAGRIASDEPRAAAV